MDKKVITFCNEMNINANKLDKEAIKILKSDKVDILELYYCIADIFGEKPSVNVVNNFLLSYDIKFHFGFDVPGWKKMNIKDYLKLIGKKELVTRYENDDSDDNSIMNEIHNILDSNENENCFVNRVLGIVYLKK